MFEFTNLSEDQLPKTFNGSEIKSGQISKEVSKAHSGEAVRVVVFASKDKKVGYIGQAVKGPTGTPYDALKGQMDNVITNKKKGDLVAELEGVVAALII